MEQVQLKPEEVSQALQYLFQRYLRDKQIPPDDVPDLQPAEFLAWLRTVTISEYELSLKLGIAEHACRFAIGLAHDPSGPNKLIALWPYMILASRTVKQPVKSMNLLMMLNWVDGAVYWQMICMHRDLMEKGQINDASVCSTIIQNAQNLLPDVMQRGLDTLHQEAAEQMRAAGPETVQLLKDMVQGKTTIHEVSDEEKAQVSTLLAMLSTLFNVPAMVQSQQGDGGFDAEA